MKIQKGVVDYKGRNDIVCTFGVTDDGKNYYFIELEGSKRLSNGNIVASTELVEAIDPMFKAKNVGVIDASGKEVIPFIHRAIRPINSDILLAELAEPVSESVKEANRSKSDQASQAKLVSDAAAVKDKINAKIGADGRFCFNDQFSEATIYDINGNNLIGNENYSFIALSGNKLYMSKNTPEGEIVEHSLVPEDEKSPIDVSGVQVSQEVVENALTAEASSTPAEEKTSAVPEEPVVPTAEAAPVVPETATPEESVVSTAEAAPVVPEVATPQEPVVPTAEVAPVEANVNQTPLESAMASSNNGPIIPMDELIAAEKANEDAKVAAPEKELGSLLPKPKPSGKVIIISAPENQEAPAPTLVAQVAPTAEEKTEVPPAEAPVVPPVDEKVEEPIIPPVEEKVEEPVVPPVDEKAEEPVVPPVEEKTEEPVIPPVEEKTEEVIPEEVTERNETGGDIIDRSVQDTEFEETPDNEVDESDNEEIDLDESVEDSSLDDLFHEKEEEQFEDDERFIDSVIHTDRIETSDEFESHIDDDVALEEDTIMTDVAKSMQALIKQNRELKSTLSATEDKLGKVLASRRNIADKSNMQEKKIEMLTSKLRSLDSTLSKLETKYQALESKNHDQERIIDAQARELDVMRPQLQGKEDLVQLLADAQVILGDDDTRSYTRKVA